MRVAAVVAVVALAQTIGLAVGWTALTARLATYDRRMDALEAQRTSELHVVVERQEKRLDQQELALAAFKGEFGKYTRSIIEKLERIDSAVSKQR